MSSRCKYKLLLHPYFIVSFTAQYYFIPSLMGFLSNIILLRIMYFEYSGQNLFQHMFVYLSYKFLLMVINLMGIIQLLLFIYYFFSLLCLIYIVLKILQVKIFHIAAYIMYLSLLTN